MRNKSTEKLIDIFGITTLETSGDNPNGYIVQFDYKGKRHMQIVSYSDDKSFHANLAILIATDQVEFLKIQKVLNSTNLFKLVIEYPDGMSIFSGSFSPRVHLIA